MPKPQVKTTLRPDHEVRYMKGVGPGRAEALLDLGVRTVEDLMRVAPRRYLDRRTITPIASLEVGRQATVIARVFGSRASRAFRGRSRLVARVADDTGTCELVWFSKFGGLEKLLEPGAIVAASGVPRLHGFIMQLAHPDLESLGDDEELLHGGRIVPLYPMTESLKRVGIGQRSLRRFVSVALEECAHLVVDPVPDDLLREAALPGARAALRALHFPDTVEDAESARARFAFEELLVLQIGLARTRAARRVETATPVVPGAGLVDRFTASLPFTLTDGQRSALAEILDDLARPVPMARLLMGDVGSGKTAVAAACAFAVAGSGGQTAFMAPTEVLAVQHHRTLSRFLDPLGVRVALVVGGDSAERRATLDEVACGRVGVVVGTHALIEEGVAFAELRFVVVDEQHRFGVRQRLALAAKGGAPHVLVMTATPIPRTLALTMYGDLDVSAIRGLPPGRRPVETVIRGESDRAEVEAMIRDEAARGGRAYVVYPLVEQSEKLDLHDAERAYKRMSAGVFRDVGVVLVHGRMSSDGKRKALSAFASGRAPILVATTVIEVGVDVPEATMLVVEHAERFGLAQLHQLRGRVGRGSQRARCVLMSQAALDSPGSTAAERLRVLASCHDGFEIAEHDLRLRGPGEFLGTRQHGALQLRIADVARDVALVGKAREAARRMVEDDPDTARYPALRAAVDRADRLRAEASRAG